MNIIIKNKYLVKKIILSVTFCLGNMVSELYAALENADVSQEMTTVASSLPQTLLSFDHKGSTDSLSIPAKEVKVKSTLKGEVEKFTHLRKDFLKALAPYQWKIPICKKYHSLFPSELISLYNQLLSTRENLDNLYQKIIEEITFPKFLLIFANKPLP
jgi:hypothetical protein